MKVEVLYFQGCPNHVPALERVRSVLVDEGVHTDVLQVEIPDDETAQALRFMGSPSVRVNGIDVEESASSGVIGLCCRTYLYGSVREGVPPADVIRRAIRTAREASDENR
jgi:hypothetical protein